MTRLSRQQLVVGLGCLGLALMVGGCLTALGTGLISTLAEAAWLVSMGGAALAFLAGLAARGRGATLGLVVPSLVYLLLLMGPV